MLAVGLVRLQLTKKKGQDLEPLTGRFEKILVFQEDVIMTAVLASSYYEELKMRLPRPEEILRNPFGSGINLKAATGTIMLADGGRQKEQREYEKMKKNYKMTLAYDGSRYYGWEHQPDRDTIQGKLEGVLTKMCQKPIDVIGAGRTDAGVHAKAMVANAVMDTDLSPVQIRDYMNRYLPDDISVREVREASDRFHARYKAVGKLYTYTCFDGEIKPVFDRKYVAVLHQKLNVDQMKKAASYLVGKHDYKSFCGNSHMKKSTVRIVDRIEIVRKGGYVYFNFHGTGFLQNMVRILVGTLIEVGQGKRKPEDMVRILESRNRKEAGVTAPSGGLCLMKVDY